MALCLRLGPVCSLLGEKEFQIQIFQILTEIPTVCHCITTCIITLSLLVLIANNLCKQFGPRSGQLQTKKNVSLIWIQTV